MQKIQEQIQQMAPETAGKIMLVSSTGMTGVQIVTDFASLIAVGLNILIATGGLYLMYKKIWVEKKRRDRREND